MQAWLGVDLAQNCAEGAFREVISSEWQCRKQRWRCPRRTWATFKAECNLTKYGCPEAREREARQRAKQRRAEQRRRSDRRRLRAELANEESRRRREAS